jgi:hypothetical protein
VTPVGWIAFGIAIAILAVCAFAQLDWSRGAAQRALDAGMAVLGALLMAFSVAASGSAVVWLSLAFGLGVVALAVAGLTLHEISSWRRGRHLGQLRWLSQKESTARSTEYAQDRAA